MVSSVALVMPATVTLFAAVLGISSSEKKKKKKYINQKLVDMPFFYCYLISFVERAPNCHGSSPPDEHAGC